MGRDQGLDLLQQQACDVSSEEQRFTCKESNKIAPVKDSGLCVTGSGNNPRLIHENERVRAFKTNSTLGLVFLFKSQSS